MHLRKLRKQDAPLMLEWMHDESVVRDLQANFAAKTLEDCLAFIESAAGEDEDLPAAKLVYGRDFARVQSLEQMADTVGKLIQNQIKNL